MILILLLILILIFPGGANKLSLAVAAPLRRGVD